MTLTKSKRAAISERANAATEGPWESWRRGNAPSNGRLYGQSKVIGPVCPYEPTALAKREPTDIVMSDEDADFVVAARTDIPTLLASLDEADARVAAAEARAEAAEARESKLREALDLLDDLHNSGLGERYAVQAKVDAALGLALASAPTTGEVK